MKKFSIIVVCYNGAKYLKKCVQDLKKQTFKDYEIIVVDDGSDDGTQEVMGSLGEDVKCFKRKHEGVSAARNYAISKVKSKYFIFVDVDDFIEHDLLDKIDKVTNEEVDLVKFGYQLIDENNETVTCYEGVDVSVCDGCKAFIKLCESKVPFDMICLYLYNLEFWKKNKFSFEKGHFHEDFGLIPYMILKSLKFISINYCGYKYVQTINSITRTKDRKKLISRTRDYLYHYDNLYQLVNADKDINIETKKVFNSYISNAIISKANTLEGKEKRYYVEEVKKRNAVENLLSNSFLRKVKKLIAKLNLSLYLKVIK